MKTLQAAGRLPDPRAAQIERLKAANAELKKRIEDRDVQIEDLTAFKQLALSRIAAQHLAIEHLRATQMPAPTNVHLLPRLPVR